MSEFGPVSAFGPTRQVERLRRRGFIEIGYGGCDDPAGAVTVMLAKRCAKAGLVDIAAYLRTLAAAFPRFKIDPQPSNWMFREDGSLMMIDPFMRTLGDVPATALRLAEQRG